LTHRRDKDAVGELQIANRERIEQVSHTNSVDRHIAPGEFALTPQDVPRVLERVATLDCFTNADINAQAQG
jgi:hypothetical protein